MVKWLRSAAMGEHPGKMAAPVTLRWERPPVDARHVAAPPLNHSTTQPLNHIWSQPRATDASAAKTGLSAFRPAAWETWLGTQRAAT